MNRKFDSHLKEQSRFFNKIAVIFALPSMGLSLNYSISTELLLIGDIAYESCRIAPGNVDIFVNCILIKTCMFYPCHVSLC